MRPRGEPAAIAPLDTTWAPPLARRPLAVRPRLDRRLPEAGILTVVGPAGSGKTQLLLHWFNLVARHTRAAWLTLRPNLTAAQAADALQAMFAAAAEGRAAAHASRLSVAQRPLALFVDNAAARDAAVLHSFAGRLPRGSRLIVAGRSAPSVGRLSIGTEELSFTPAESVVYLEARLPRHPASGLAEWVVRCDGWPVALNVAADAVERFGDGDAARAEFDAAIAILLTDMAAGFSQAERTFLTETSLLESIDPTIAAAATGNRSASSILAQWGAALPIVRDVGSDGTLRVARYAEPLLASWRAGLEAPRRTAVHRHAAQALRDHGRAQDAVPHLLATGDVDGATALLEQGLLAMAIGGDVDRALRRTKSLPAKNIMRSERLRFAAALTLALAGEFEEAKPYLDRCKADERLVLRAVLTNFADDPDGANLLLARVGAPDALPPVLRPIFANLSRWIAYRQTGALLPHATTLDRSPGDDDVDTFHSRCFSVFRQADHHLASGQAARAEATLLDPLKRSDSRLGQHAFPSKLLATVLAAARLQQGDAAGARAALAGRPAADDQQVAEVLVMIATVDVRLAAAAGEWDRAMGLLDRFELLAHERGLPRLRAFCLAERLRSCGDVLQTATVRRIADALERIGAAAAQSPISAPWIILSTILGRAHAARLNGELPAQRPMLACAMATASRFGRAMLAAEIALLASTADGKPLDGSAAALAGVAPGDLRALANRLRLPLDECFARAPEPEDAADAPIVILRTTDVCLTAREREILAHLALNASNKSIARAFKLGVETVKWHVTNLIRKLGAVDRHDAVDRARALGLTPP